jgi:hypothetical protein
LTGFPAISDKMGSSCEQPQQNIEKFVGGVSSTYDNIPQVMENGSWAQREGLLHGAGSKGPPEMPIPVIEKGHAYRAMTCQADYKEDAPASARRE